VSLICELIFDRPCLRIEIYKMISRPVIPYNGLKDLMRMRRGHVDEFLVPSLITSPVKKIKIYTAVKYDPPDLVWKCVPRNSALTTHAVNNDQEVTIHICKAVSVIDSLIPTPDRANLLTISRRQTICCRNDRFQTLNIAREFPIHAQRGLDDEA